MDYLKNSTVPDRKVKGVIVDYRISPKSAKALNDMGITVIFTEKVSALDKSICGHPDMIIHHFGENNFIVAPEMYDFFTQILPDANIIKGNLTLKEKYPNDIAYNTAVFGKYVICNTSYTAPEILSEYTKMGKKILNVRQGYSKCSICVISDNAIITSDNGIYKIASDNGIDALQISAGHIELPGMSYGFIGGATGLLDKNLLAVNGNIKNHPDYDEINCFCSNHGVNIISLNCDEIVDIGSIIPIF